MKELFPNCEVIGNFDELPQLEYFEVYVRGVGPVDRRDHKGRLYIFKKNEKLKPFIENFTSRIIRAYDELVLLSLAYGDTIELEKVSAY